MQTIGNHSQKLRSRAERLSSFQTIPSNKEIKVASKKAKKNVWESERSEHTAGMA